MSPDDPRHGTYAGMMAHRNDSSTPCEPCRAASRRYNKRRHVLGCGIVELGETAHRLVCDMPMVAFADATGLPTSHIRKLRKVGPTGRVQRATRDRILAAERPMSLLGARRRLQALAVLGWSTHVLAERAGCHPDNLGEIRRGAVENFIGRTMAARIKALYDELHMTPAPPGRSASWAKTYAAKHGWVPPLAWDDIDNDEVPADTNQPGHRPRSDVDEVAVLLTLEGRKPNALTRGEVDEVVRRWQQSGRSLGECERVTGVNTDRALKRMRASA